jgi:hypothetical protein
MATHGGRYGHTGRSNTTREPDYLAVTADIAQIHIFDNVS